MNINIKNKFLKGIIFALIVSGIIFALALLAMLFAGFGHGSYLYLLSIISPFSIIFPLSFNLIWPFFHWLIIAIALSFSHNNGINKSIKYWLYIHYLGVIYLLITESIVDSILTLMPYGLFWIQIIWIITYLLLQVFIWKQLLRASPKQ